VLFQAPYPILILDGLREFSKAIVHPCADPERTALNPELRIFAQSIAVQVRILSTPHDDR